MNDENESSHNHPALQPTQIQPKMSPPTSTSIVQVDDHPSTVEEILEQMICVSSNLEVLKYELICVINHPRFPDEELIRMARNLLIQSNRYHELLRYWLLSLMNYFNHMSN